MKPRRLLARVTDGATANVEFADFRRLVEAFGFRLVRVSGSHHALAHSAIPELLNLQPVHAEAKPYQIRQFLRLVERYNLSMDATR